MTKRVTKPSISAAAQQLLATYEAYLADVLNLRPATIRNYNSDLRLFMAWCEQSWRDGGTETDFSPERIATRGILHIPRSNVTCVRIRDFTSFFNQIIRKRPV